MPSGAMGMEGYFVPGIDNSCLMFDEKLKGNRTLDGVLMYVLIFPESDHESVIQLEALFDHRVFLALLIGHRCYERGSYSFI